MEDVTIGLETHIQLDTDTKLFCGCPVDLSAKPNDKTCEVCLGMPGAKPKTNAAVVSSAIKASLALNCEINDVLQFSRKVYFYPDMSKNFQITQYELPVGEKGSMQIGHGEDEIDVGIRRLHIEEDPARMEHVGGEIGSADYTRVDYNRAGVPLLEIVTEPDFSSPEEARMFLRKLTRLMEYLGVYDSSSDLAIKSDANISIGGGERVEVKNITGTKGIEKALRYEITRQRNLSKRGRNIERETRAYSSAQEITSPLRQKEFESGYGYILEPDLPRNRLSSDRIDSVQDSIPELPDVKRERFIEEYGISPAVAESLVSEKAIADVFEECAEQFDARLVASWMAGEVKKTLNYNDCRYVSSALTKDDLMSLFRMLSGDAITERNAEKALRKVVGGEGGIEAVVDKYTLKADGSVDLSGVVSDVCSDHSEAVEDIKHGKDEAVNFLVGQVMEATGGKVDPRKARETLLEAIDTNEG